MQTLLLSTLLFSFINIGSPVSIGKTTATASVVTITGLHAKHTPAAATLNKAGSCPVCHRSDKVIPIKYGRPGTALIKLAEAGKVKLGGCVVSEKSHRLYCRRDQVDF